PPSRRGVNPTRLSSATAPAHVSYVCPQHEQVTSGTARSGPFTPGAGTRARGGRRHPGRHPDASLGAQGAPRLATGGDGGIQWHRERESAEEAGPHLRPAQEPGEEG